MDRIHLTLQGVFTGCISFGLLTVGCKYLPAPEVSLFMLVETILGQVWVFLGGFEKPPLMTIVGGSLLVMTIAINRYRTVLYFALLYWCTIALCMG